MLERLTLSDFETHVGRVFEIDHPDGSRVPLGLTEANALRAYAHPLKTRDPFDLLFKAPAPLLAQGIYAFEFGADDRREIFIVPIALQNGIYTYQAIFN